MDDSKLTAQLRLFGLLALLVPLFLGLQYIVREGVPRVEVRLVTQDVQRTVPVEVPVERVVERVVYVPVERAVSVPASAGTESAQTSLPLVAEAEDQAKFQVADGSEGAESSPEAEAPAPAAVAESSSTTPPLTGTVAVAPPAPAPVAAPVVVARAAPAAPVYVPPAEVVFADEGETFEMVAEAEPPEAAPEDGFEVAEAADEATEEVAVVQFVSEQPVLREDGGSSIAMLRHELAVRESRTVPVEEAAVEEPAPPVMAEEVGPAEGEAAAAEPEASEPAAADEEAGEAPPISSEELLAHAPSIKTEMFDHGSNNEQSLGVLEGQLVARPAGPPPAARSEDGAEPGPEAEGEVVVATADADESGEADEPALAEAPAALDETAWGEGDDDGGVEEPVAVQDSNPGEVARAEEGAAAEEDPEQ